MVSETEVRMNAVERLLEYSNLPQEASRIVANDNDLIKSWPSVGKIQFQNVQMKYRPTLPLALKIVAYRTLHGFQCEGIFPQCKYEMCVSIHKEIENSSMPYYTSDMPECGSHTQCRRMCSLQLGLSLPPICK